MMSARFLLCTEPIDVDTHYRNLSNPAAGGFVTFEGRVRAESIRGRVARIDYEAYPALCRRVGDYLARGASATFGLLETVVVHRTGSLLAGETAIWIGVSGRHRKESFAACAWILERIKADLPVWKKEVLEDGSGEWVHESPADPTHSIHNPPPGESMPMQHPTRTVTLIGLAAVLSATAFGAEPGADSLKALPEVKVVAGHVRQDLRRNGPANPYRVEAAAQAGTEVLTQEDIQALEPRDVIDLLDKSVGLNVTYQGRRSPFFVDERGGGSMTYILNGSVLPSSSNRILQNIPVEAIEEIQIVRGSTSLALGPSIPIGSASSASGINTGFVIIRTRQPSRTEASVTGSVEKSASQPVADGQSVWVGTVLGKPDGLSGFVGGMGSRSETPSKDSWFDGRSSDMLLLTGGMRYGKLNVTGTAYIDSGRFEMQRGLTLADTLDPSKWYYDPLITTVLSTDATMAWSGTQTTIASGFWTKFEQNEINESFANATHSERFFTERSQGLGLRHNAQFGGTLLSVGSQYSISEGFGPNTNTTYNDWRTTILGWSGSAEQKLFSDRLTLDAGYRQDAKHIDHSTTVAGKIRADNDVDLAPSRTTTFGGAWSQDLFTASANAFLGWEGDGDFSLATKSGKPLHAMDQSRVEATLEVRPLPWLVPSVTWFSVDIENQKAATTDTYSVAGSTYYYYTETDVVRNGLEMRLKSPRTALWAGISGSCDLSWTKLLTNDTKTDSSTSDAIGVSVPENIYTARVGVDWMGWRLTVTGKNVDPWVQSTSSMGTANNVWLGDYIRMDASLAKTFPIDRFHVDAQVYGRNLGNDHYSTRYTTGYYRDRGLTVGSRLTVGI